MLLDRDLDAWFAEAKEDGNPYLTEWFAVAAMAERLSSLHQSSHEEWRAAYTQCLQNGTHEYAARRQLVGKYAWAVPCRAALDALSKYAPLVEIGSGTGYWAWLLRKRGVEIATFDRNPPPSNMNTWHGSNTVWTKIERGGSEVLPHYAGHTLFLCWPPYNDPMAAECLNVYRGNHLIFVGEGDGGCTGDDEFWSLLGEGWEQVEDVELPQFYGIHDYMQILRRKGNL